MSVLAELKRRNVLRVGATYIAVAWLLVQVVETLAPAFGFGDSVLRYLVIGLVIALVPVLALSWAFELTPEGLKRDGEAAADTATGVRNARRLDRMLVVTLALGLAYFAFDKFFLDPARDAEREAEVAREARTEALTESYGEKSIAVLPFTNMSADPQQEYFSDGISEEILNLLAQIPDLRVISRSSAFTFKGEKLQLPEIAARLNVAHILEGSVRRSGDRIRITAQLVDAVSDTHLWSQTYDRELDDIFAIQDDVAERVVEELKLRLLGDLPRSQRTDPRVLALTMQARRLLDQFGDPDATYRLLEEARTLDPDYAPVWTAFARLYFRLGYLNFDRGSLVDLRGVAPEEAQRWSREAVDRAIEIDPDNAVAWGYRAYAAAMSDRQAGAALYEKALSLGPGDVDALRAASVFANSIGRFDAAIDLMRRAVQRDPLCQTCWYNLGRAQRNAGKYEDAIESLQTAGSSGAAVDYSVAVTRVLAGDPRRALEDIDKTAKDARSQSHRLHLQALAYHSMDRAVESAAALSELTAMLNDRSVGRDTSTLLELLAQACAWTGHSDRAFEYLHRMFPADVEDEFLDSDVLFHPLYAPLHSDPRWRDLTERFSVAPWQLAAIEFELPSFD